MDEDAEPAADAAHTVAALNLVRHDLARLGSDAMTAEHLPDPPADVTARLSAALAAVTPPASRASHAARGSVASPRTVALVIGGLAALAAVGIGIAALRDTAPPTPPTGATADRITVSRPSVDFPVPRAELLALLDRPADLSGLSDPAQRAACLSALGRGASAPVLGADNVDVGGRPAILLVLGDGYGAMTALVVAPTCNATDPGVIAETVLVRATTPS
ncbi:hypothetical protein [Mycolicibacterium sp. 624]|uniref:hypothetical protein n=1 Tax=Mycolicibacterium sp. 624 TaxID=3156314 RepID=UPI003394D8B8